MGVEEKEGKRVGETRSPHGSWAPTID